MHGLSRFNIPPTFEDDLDGKLISEIVSVVIVDFQFPWEGREHTGVHKEAFGYSYACLVDRIGSHSPLYLEFFPGALLVFVKRLANVFVLVLI